MELRRHKKHSEKENNPLIKQRIMADESSLTEDLALNTSYFPSRGETGRGRLVWDHARETD
jgi:hypothetical protein